MKDIITRLKAARISLLLDSPFYGNVALKMRFIENNEFETCATDGMDFYYNKEFLEELDVDELKFVVAHEVMHCVLAHCSNTRRGSRNPFLFNIAADHVINNDLVAGGLTMPRNVEGCCDYQYRGWATEAVYDKIKDENKNGQQSLDCHIVIDPNNGSATIVTASGQLKKSKNIKPKTAEQRAKESREMQSAIIQATKQAGSGGLPQMIKNWVNDFTNPKIDWTTALIEHITSLVKDDFTFSRPNKRTLHSGITIPAFADGKSINIVCAIDTSGSVSTQMVKDFLSEIKNITDTYKDFNITVLCFSGEVSDDSVKVFTPMNVTEMEEYSPNIGGGTEFMCVWDYLEENDIEPDCLVVFTDGYPWNEWGIEGRYETVFLIHGADHIEPPFGTPLYY